MLVNIGTMQVKFRIMSLIRIPSHMKENVPNMVVVTSSNVFSSLLQFFIDWKPFMSSLKTWGHTSEGQNCQTKLIRHISNDFVHEFKIARRM